MLYAVSIETSRPVRRGRLRRRVNVFVEARDGDEAQYLARLRFRHRPEARSLVVRGVRGVPLRTPAHSGASAEVSTPPSPAAQRKRGAKRRKSKRYGSPGKTPRGKA
ncbi:MAG: hypothetical protein IT563_09795 [Alphaproteobacteria bacterium]|nr:hypothetical protein [Alphaproteobacteria bacterium]